MILAIDTLRRMNPPYYLDVKLHQFQLRILNQFPGFTIGEIKNLCLGLEALLRENPMDWKAEGLLRRLQTMLDNQSDQKQK